MYGQVGMTKTSQRFWTGNMAIGYCDGVIRVLIRYRRLRGMTSFIQSRRLRRCQHRTHKSCGNSQNSWHRSHDLSTLRKHLCGHISLKTVLNHLQKRCFKKTTPTRLLELPHESKLLEFYFPKLPLEFYVDRNAFEINWKTWKTYLTAKIMKECSSGFIYEAKNNLKYWLVIFISFRQRKICKPKNKKYRIIQ